MEFLSISLRKNERLELAFCRVYGIGPSMARRILASFGLGQDLRVSQIPRHQWVKMTKDLEREQILVNQKLRKEIKSNRDRLLQIACYRGIRHREGLPCRGQRTRTNGGKHMRKKK